MYKGVGVWEGGGRVGGGRGVGWVEGGGWGGWREGGGVGGGGGWEAGGGLHRPTGPLGVAMSPRSASHRPRHDWRALRDVSPTQG